VVKEIVLTIGDESCTAELLTEQAPNLCAAIERALPIRAPLTHAKLVDREVFLQLPFLIDIMENEKVSAKGDIGFWNGRQTLCIFYDDMQPLGAQPTFARMTGNVDGFRRAAADVWEHPGQIITIMAKEA
jgi:hypothetical protein